MSLNQNLRVGNLILYVGSLNTYFNSIGEILSIDEINHEHTYLLRVKNWNKEENEIRAYKNEIWAITLELTHLVKLGFKKDEKINIFRLNNVTLTRPILIYNGGQRIVDKGFVVVVKDILLPPSEEQIDEATIPVTSLHSLQNYFSGHLNQEIEKALFL